MFCQYMCFMGIGPTTFALLMQCSTTEPQEHMVMILIIFVFIYFFTQTKHSRLLKTEVKRLESHGLL